MNRRRNGVTGHVSSRRVLPLVLASLIVGAWFLFWPTFLSGQVVQGTLTDARTRFVVSDATVALRDSTGAFVATTTSNYLGVFRITAPGPGVYSLVAEAMGYRSPESETFEIQEGEVTTIDLFLSPQPIELDTLAVQSRRQRIVASLEEQGFYNRQRQGIGTFLTPEQIRRWVTIKVGDVLRHAPFVQVETGGVQGSRVFITRLGRCEPAIYVDGNRIRSSPDDWVSAEDIVAVEVYRGPAQIPAQWAQFETCGVILIWTNLGGG